MTTMMTGMYDALRTSRASEDQVRAVAQVVAANEARLGFLQWLFIAVLFALLMSWVVPYFAI